MSRLSYTGHNEWLMGLAFSYHLTVGLEHLVTLLRCHVFSKGANTCCFPTPKKLESMKMCSDFYSQGELPTRRLLICHRYEGKTIPTHEY